MAQMTNYQVFPVTKESFKGVPTAEDVVGKKYSLVMAEVAGDVTFNFAGFNPVTVTMQPGQVVAINRDCQSITSPISVVIS